MQSFSMISAPLNPYYTTEELQSMTKAQLVELGNSLGVEGLNDKMLKADIIAAIEEAMGWI